MVDEIKSNSEETAVRLQEFHKQSRATSSPHKETTVDNVLTFLSAVIIVGSIIAIGYSFVEENLIIGCSAFTSLTFGVLIYAIGKITKTLVEIRDELYNK